MLKPRTSTAKDQRTLEERLNDRVCEILREGTKHPLPEKTQAQIDAIMEKAVRELT